MELFKSIVNTILEAVAPSEHKILYFQHWHLQGREEDNHKAASYDVTLHEQNMSS